MSAALFFYTETHPTLHPGCNEYMGMGRHPRCWLQTMLHDMLPTSLMAALPV